jgi:hypothetical protein
MALNDGQWAAQVTDIVAALIAETITAEQAAAQLAAATGDWTVSASAILELAQRVSRFLAKLNGLVVMDGPPDPGVGELNTWCFDRLTGDFFGPKTAAGWGASSFSLVGPPGKSALDIVIAAGELPAGATDQDFADWLADAQIAAVEAAVQPMVNAVEADRQAVDTAAGQVEADRQAVDATAVQVEADRAAIAADRAVVVMKAGEVEGDRQAVDAAAVSVEADRQAVGADAGQVETDRQAVEATAVQVEAGRTAVAADRVVVVTKAGEVEDDRQAVDAAVGAVEADRQAVDTAAGQVETDRQAVDAAAVQVETMRGEAQQFRNEAEQFKNEAGDIAGGDFLTEAAANALYRQLAVLLNITDVNGLAAALAGKATPADIADAVQAIVGMAPAELDTLKEIADRLVGAEGDYAALVLVLAGKASQDALDALAAIVADKAAQADLVAALARVTMLEAKAVSPWVAKTAAFAAQSGDRILADTTVTAWSLTLPASGEVSVQDVAGTWPSKHLTVVGPIRGSAGDMVCDQSASLLFIRPPGAAAWIVTKSEGISA